VRARRPGGAAVPLDGTFFVGIGVARLPAKIPLIIKPRTISVF
jgi:hypothetical protein